MKARLLGKPHPIMMIRERQLLATYQSRVFTPRSRVKRLVLSKGAGRSGKEG